MAYFDALLQQAITVRNNRAPASNTADLVGGVLVAIVTALQMLLDDKQDELTFDTTPTADSPKPVTSDGIYQALQAIDLSACEKIVNKVTSIDAQSTDIQYPSAKLLYDQLQGLAAVYAPKVHTHPFADIERPANVASVNAQGYTITTAYYSHVLTITADATLHLPTMQSGAAIILRLTIIQDATGGRAVTFDGGAALVFNPYQTDLSLGQANYRCWVVLWFDGVNWAWLASPYVLRAESQFAYTIDGTTGGQYVTVTINGTTMQIQATSGVWQYGYNNPINSIAFTGDTGVLNVDFTNSDGLANITTLADAFKNCAALVAVDFTGCDLSNVATAADCFAGCTSLAALTIPTGTWKPDIDLSACAAFTKAAMLAVIDGLYTYASGTHTVTFNSTAWDALSQADQQQVYNAAAAKGWTTNAVAVTYYIRGNSSVHNGTEKFRIQFIDDGSLTPSAAENINIATDANGDFEYQYNGKKIYSLETFKNESKTTLLSIEFTEELSLVTNALSMFEGCTNLVSASFPNATFNNCTDARAMFYNTKIVNLSLPEATFGGAANYGEIFAGMPQLETISLPKATFANMTHNGGAGSGADYGIFYNCPKLQSVSLPEATFASLQNATGMFWKCTLLQSVSIPKATFASLQVAKGMFNACSNLESVSFPQATFANLQNANGMFALCAKLTTIEWSAALNLNNITSLGNIGGSGADNYGIFYGCSMLPNSAIAPFANFTFANCNSLINAFSECHALTKIDLHSATFANLTTCWAAFYNSYNVAEIDLSAATFAKVSTTVFAAYNAFQKLNALTTLKVPTNSTAILPTSSATNAPLNIAQSPLTYQSIEDLANWLSDLTGQSAHTVTFKATAWNTLTAAEQATIQGILSGKNWTLATA